MVTFPAAEHNCPLVGTKLYCLVTEAHGCEQLAQGCCLEVHRPRVEPANSRSRVRHANHYTTKPPRLSTRTIFAKLCDIVYKSPILYLYEIIPVSELGLERKESRSWWRWHVKTEECVMLDANFPQVLTLTIAAQVEADQTLCSVHLHREQQK